MEDLTATGVSKLYGDHCALTKTSVSFRAGSFTAIVGGNGAGKSTLLNLMGAVNSPSTGTVRLGKSTIRSVRAALLQGIGFAHQESSLVPHWTVADHFPMPRSTRTRWASTHRGEMEPWRDLAPEVNADQRITTLSSHQQQCLEVARALACARRAVLVDEPTALLGLAERTKVLEALARAARAGLIVIWVTHDLTSALAYADRLLVIRDGTIVCDEPTSAMSVPRILEGMGAGAPVPPRAASTTSYRGSSGKLLLRPAAGRDIEIRSGEIVGLIGTARSRLRGTLRGSVGLEATLHAPALLDGAVLPAHISAALRAGVVYMSRERSTEWLIDRQSVALNIAVGSLRNLAAVFGLSDRRLSSHAGAWAEKFDVKAASMQMDIEGLSGGNRQKAVLARLAAMRPGFMLLDEPFSGVDRPTRTRLFHLLRDMAQGGTGIAIYSQESADLVAAADRVVVMTADDLRTYPCNEVQATDIEYTMLSESSGNA